MCVLQAVKQNSAFLSELLAATEPVRIPVSSSVASMRDAAHRHAPTEDVLASGQSRYDLYALARRLLPNLTVVAVIDPLDLTLSCKPMIADVQCTLVTTAPVSLSFAVGGRVSGTLDESGVMIQEGYFEYSVVTLVAQGVRDTPVLQAAITMVRKFTRACSALYCEWLSLRLQPA